MELLLHFKWKRVRNTEAEAKACCGSLALAVKTWLKDTQIFRHFEEQFAKQRKALSEGLPSVLAPGLTTEQTANAVMAMIEPIRAAAASGVAATANEADGQV